jgi:hypothetical protein
VSIFRLTAGERKMSCDKNYRVKVLDMKYETDCDHLIFHYLTYEVLACHEKEAVAKAKEAYMKGEQALFSDEVPFLLKLFSVSSSSKT